MIWIVLGMALVTFGIRFILYARADKMALPNWMEGALRYVPVSVLTAIIVPMMILPSPNHTVSLSWHNPWLVGGVIAFIIGLGFRQPLITIVGGVVAFFLAKFFLAA